MKSHFSDPMHIRFQLRRFCLVLVCVACLLLSSCKPDPPQPDAPPATPAKAVMPENIGDPIKTLEQAKQVEQLLNQAAKDRGAGVMNE